jgi:hypothetical protein
MSWLYQKLFENLRLIGKDSNIDSLEMSWREIFLGEVIPQKYPEMIS